MYFSNNTFLLVGISKSGYACTLALLKRGAKCYIYDEALNDETKVLYSELIDKGAIGVDKDDCEKTVDKVDIVVLSPGVPIDSEIPSLAYKLGKFVTGELEIGYRMSLFPIIAVTGTNGKTTTCTLINQIFNHAKIKSYLAGNIGTPLCSVCDKSDCFTPCVVEVSSFQLETVSAFMPHIACVLNITPDHLDRHYNMQNYVYLKSKILLQMRESEYAVLNADDETVCSFSKLTKAKCIFFSRNKTTNGAYLQNGMIFYGQNEICKSEELLLKGNHNIENVLACVCIAKLCNVQNDIIKEALCGFVGVKYRQEKIAEINGVTYINDSKATNPDSALKAVDSLNGNIILLVGGIDKGAGYEEFFEKLFLSGKVKMLIIYGQSRKILYDHAEQSGIKNAYVCVEFDRAVKTAFEAAVSGDTVLLSPACSSFDEFKGYEERGERYTQLINRLNANE